MDALFNEAANRWSAGAGSEWWNAFYADRTKPIPFFRDVPDENLATYVDSGIVRPGLALDLGCGSGRNARFLAARGFDVDAIDLSETAIAWAREHSSDSSRLRFHVGDAFGDEGASLTGPYGLVYDSGCLHHLPPHRRVSYLHLLDRVLAPGGTFAVACFAAGQMGSEASDLDLYRLGRLGGGLGFTPESLRWIFHQFEEVEIRPMVAHDSNSGLFGEPFLLTAAFKRRKPGLMSTHVST